MAAKIRLIGAYRPQSEGLAVSYTSLTKSRVTTGGMEMLMNVVWLRYKSVVSVLWSFWMVTSRM